MNRSLYQYQSTERNLNNESPDPSSLFMSREFTDNGSILYTESNIGDFSLKSSYPRVLNPKTCFKKTWDYTGVVLSLYSCLVIPFFIAFYLKRPLIYTILDLIIDIYFSIDLILNFFSSRINNSGLELKNLKSICKAYLKSLFIVDLVSCFPIDKILYLFYPVTNPGIIIVEMLKILRMHRVSVISRNRLKIFNRALQIFIYLGVLLHVIGCIWYIIVRQDKDWIPYQDLEMHKTSLYDSALWSKYVVCLYEGIWLIFGQEIAPRSLLEIWGACFALTLGMVITSYLFGEMLMIISRLGLKYKIRRKALDFCLDVTNKIKLSPDLKKSILDYTTNVYPTLSSQAEFDRLFKYLSPGLQSSILKHIYRPIFNSNELFEHDLPLSEYLMSRVRYQFYLPEEEIVTEGTRSNDFYILASGVCTVFIKTRAFKKVHLGFINEGKHFGEIGLIYKTYRTASVVSHVYSTVAHLTKSEFRTLSTAFPYIIDKLKEQVLSYNDPWNTFVVNSLTQSAALDSLPAAVIQELVYKMKIMKIPAGGYLFKRGEHINGIYLITSGTFHLTTSLNSSYSNNMQIDTNESNDFEGREIQLTLINDKSKKVKAEVIPVLSEESEQAEISNSSELDLGLIGQGTLVYSYTGLKRGILHRLDCKAKENSSVYWIDCEMIRHLGKEFEGFKKVAESQVQANFFDFLNSDDSVDNARFRFKCAVAKVIFLNRERKQAKQEKFKEMLNLLRAVVACQNAGNNHLAEMVMKGKIKYSYITADGHLDTAFMYKGSLPNSHRVIKTFDDVLSDSHKSSLVKQSNSLKSEILALAPKVKMTRDRIGNCVNLMNTLKNLV